MSESFWESEEVESEEVEEARPEESDAESSAEPASDLAPDLASDLAAEPAAVALSADDFTALEERVLRAVDLVKRERLARTAAEQRANAAEAQLREAAPMAERLEKEVSALHTERDHVRQRVERLLSQLDALEL
jgi:hypothetical protein